MENALNMTTNEVEKYMREQVRMNEFYNFSFTREYIEVVGEYAESLQLIVFTLMAALNVWTTKSISMVCSLVAFNLFMTGTARL